MNSAQDDSDFSETRFRIQKSPDRCLFASSPELIAGYHVFRRLSMPRHPPYTLSSLTTFIDHRLLNLKNFKTQNYARNQPCYRPNSHSFPSGGWAVLTGYTSPAK